MIDFNDSNFLDAIKNPNDKNRIFKAIVEKYQEQIYFHIRRMVYDHDDANDLVQDTFLKVFTNMENFRGESNLYTWIYRIATNICLNFIAKRKRQYVFRVLSWEDDVFSRLKSDSYFDGDEAQVKLQQAILKLPEKQRLVFNMKYYNELKYEEISEILKTSVGALKASYHHAVNKIEKFINDN